MTTLLSLTSLVLLLLVVEAESIVCAEKENATCTVESDVSHPWSTKDQQPAPVPQNLSYNFYEPHNTYSFINITWTQKGSDMAYVDGYYMEITSPYMGNSLTYHASWNKANLEKEYTNDQRYVTFSFDNIRCVTKEMSVKLFALPSYLENTYDYAQSIIINTDKCIQEELDVPDYSGGFSSDYGGDYDQDDTETDIYYENYGRETSSPTVQDRSTGELTTEIVPTVTSPRGISLPYTLLACALTAIVTGLIIGMLVLVYRVCRKRRHIKGRISHDEQIIPAPTKKDDGKVKILIVATMGDGGHDGACDSYYKKIALCLKSILEDSAEYEVSCNLLTANELSEKGVAIWAHELVKNHDKIVALCSPSITENIDYVHGYTLLPGKVYMDASLQILQSFVLNHHLSDTELIFACLDDPPSHCPSLSLLGLKHCKHTNLVYEFPKFIDSLSKNRSYVSGQKIATMWSDFRLMLEKNVTQKATAPQPVTTTALKICNETQYDSVYSSRCNSHSTESISSHEDTGFHEGNHDKLLSAEQYTFLGARPKISA